MDRINDKSKIISCVIFFLIGFAGMGIFWQFVKPTEIQQLESRVNLEIKNLFCDAIRTDLQKFDSNPLSFKRSTINAILSESIEKAKIEFSLIIDFFI